MGKETKIAYQNKDIMSKVMAEEFKGKSFEAYGVNLPKIIDTRPTELAAVEANELRMDRLFLLEDQSYLLVDYESDYSEEKKAKYLGYLARLIKTMYNEHKYYPRLKLLILYTADVTRAQTQPDWNIDCLSMHMEEAFLSEIDGEELWKRVSEKIWRGAQLDDKDMMQIIIYPLTFKEKEEKQAAIQRMVELSDKIPDEKKRLFALKGLLVFCDKVIRKEDAEKIRRMLMLTQVEQIIEQEKQEAIEQAVAEATERVTREVTEKVRQSVSEKIASNLLRAGSELGYVASNTGLPIEEIKKLQAAL